MKTVVAALIKKDGKYLIAKRSTGNPDLIGKWEFPGGKVENSETDEAALEREILEEFDTLVTIGKMRAFAEVDSEHILKLYECEHRLGPYRLKVHSEVKWLDIPQMSDYDLAPADQKLFSQINPSEKKPNLSELIVGQSYNNADIQRIFQTQNAGGIRSSKRANALILVTKHNGDNPYDDRWKNGEMHYTGQPDIGDQSLDYRYNKTLAESNIKGISIHYFESFDGNSYIYRGRVRLSGKPYYETQKDKDGRPRRVVKFPLKMLD